MVQYGRDDTPVSVNTSADLTTTPTVTAVRKLRSGDQTSVAFQTNSILFHVAAPTSSTRPAVRPDKHLAPAVIDSYHYRDYTGPPVPTALRI